MNVYEVKSCHVDLVDGISCTLQVVEHSLFNLLDQVYTSLLHGLGNTLRNMKALNMLLDLRSFLNFIDSCPPLFEPLVLCSGLRINLDLSRASERSLCMVMYLSSQDHNVTFLDHASLFILFIFFIEPS